MKRLACGMLALCLCLGLLLTGCGSDGTGQGFRLPLDRDPAQLDPQFALDTPSAAVLSALFEGLTRLDAQGQPVPGAADWEVSPDGLVYTFTLKESYWSTLKIRKTETPWDDPVPVTADDFVFGFQRAVSPQANIATAKALFGVVNAKAVHAGEKPPEELGVKAVSDRVLTITLTAPDAHFLNRLAGLPCMPCSRDFFEYTKGRYGLEKNLLISNGPFWLSLWDHGESLLLYKNEHYHGADEIAPEAVRYVIGAEESADALLSGDLDVTYLPAADLAKARDEGLQVVPLEDTVRSLWFSAGTAPFNNLSVRQALRDAIQWEAVYAYLEGQGEAPAMGLVPPAARTSDGSLYRQDSNRRPFAVRAEQARQELGQGLKQLYPDDPAPRLPSVTLLTADDPVSVDLAKYIIQSWQKNLKLFAAMKPMPANRVEAALRSGLPGGTVAICVHTPGGLSGAENLTAFASDSPLNYSGYRSPAADTAIKAALSGGRSELDRLETLLLEDSPVLPLSCPKRYYGLSAQVWDMTVRPFGGGVFGAPLDFRHAKKKD